MRATARVFSFIRTTFGISHPDEPPLDNAAESRVQLENPRYAPLDDVFTRQTPLSRSEPNVSVQSVDFRFFFSVLQYFLNFLKSDFCEAKRRPWSRMPVKAGRVNTTRVTTRQVG